MSFKNLLLSIFILLLFSPILLSQNSFIQKADSLKSIGEYDKANLIYEKQKTSFLTKKDYANYLKTSLLLAENLEERDSSISILEKAVKTVDDLNKDSLLAVVYHKLANIYYSDFDQFKIAISNWSKSLKIREKLFKQNHLEIVTLFKNIGNGYINLEKLEQGKKLLLKAVDLNAKKTTKDSILLIRTYRDLASVYLNLEELDKAKKLLDVALEGYKNYYSEEPWIISAVYENIADYYRKRENYSKVISTQKEILNLYHSLEEKWEEDYVKLANCYNNLGLGYDLMDSLSIALKQYEKAIKINKQYVTNNNEALAINYNNISNAYRRKGEYKKAIKAIDKAIEYDLETASHIGLATSLNDKSIILLKQGEISLALATNEKAATLLNLEPDNLVLDKALLVIILNDKLKILKALAKEQPNYLQEAPKIIHQITTLTNQIRTDYQSDESKSFLSKKSKPIFENAIETILQLYQQTGDKKYISQAFQLAEQSKSIILMDALQQAQARQTTNVPTELLDKENTLKRQIAQKEKALFLQEADAYQLNNDLIQLNRELEKLTDTLKQNYPKYHQEKYATKLPNLETIQNQIAGTLIEYFVGDSTIYIFKIAKNQANIEYVEIQLDFPLANWIKQLREGIYKPHLQKLRSDEEEKKYAQDLVNIAYQLHQKLIAPIIKASEPNEKLIIIPDGILGYIPFDVLISQAPTEATLFGAHDYLINDFQISYAYSVASLLEMQKKQFATAATKKFTAFAPSFEGTNEVAFVRNIDAIRGELSPLEYNIPEVTAIQQLIGGNLFTGMDATRRNFIQHAANSKIVHLATHGKANDETGDYAFLAFTDTKDSTDFKLYNRDLYNLDLKADMVVLSACETGIGELQKGEGIISLARGFTYAGAKSIVTTLWSINDNRTKEIMEHFYTNLKTGQTKDAALRQAKLDFIGNYSHNAHPFFWAAFIPIGDMGVIELGNDWSWQFGLIGVIGLLFFFFWWRRE